MVASDTLIFLCVFGGAIVLFRVLLKRDDPADLTPPADEQRAVLLFKDGLLHDISRDAKTAFGREVTTVDSFQTAVALAFPDLSLGEARKGAIDVSNDDIGCRIVAQGDGTSLRVEVSGIDRLAMARHAQSCALLDDIARHAPQLIWQQTAQGQIPWSNHAYRDLKAQSRKTEGPLFADLAQITTAEPLRLRIDAKSDRWFDVTTRAGDGYITCFAIETTALVAADTNRRDSIKTLGRTFADLSTGLAIFDKDRQLKMFNPALLEMSKLPFAFLSARPRIDTFFDRLREIQMTPEPKDYASWREQFLAVEADAKQGNYCENWPLPDGQTYRVTGRPHPDGAFALLFEDITAEISLTRRFRTEIETGQAVLDSLSDAIAVFTQAGSLVMSNAAYSTLWNCTFHHFAHRTLGTELSHWSERAVASPAWAEIQSVALQTGDRQGWTGDLLMLDGRPLRCIAQPLDGGMTLVRFVQTAGDRVNVHPLPEADTPVRARLR